MLAEVGHFILISGITANVIIWLISCFSYLAPSKKNPFIKQTTPLFIFSFLSILTATIILGIGFVNNDFSVQYIASHSNSALPIAFKIAAIWGGHEGSFLFMLLALSTWSALFSLNKSLPFEFKNATQLALSSILILLGIYCLWLSNPFTRLFPVPIEGRDLNPMLQDIGLIIHPPLLYLGYIGFALPFCFAVAALLTQSQAQIWIKQCQQMTLITWAFLTAGIGLGAWWAYHELGWGGWWFWDPVENASLLPWLTATALIHSQIVTKKNNEMLGWTILLAIFSFSLSILGTFVVRSGVLTSVHAFAADPMKGNGLLLILAILLVPALILFAKKMPSLQKSQQEKMSTYQLWFLIATSLLSAMMLIVMLGTFYPMIYAALGLGTLSVGAPYFNLLFVPLALLAAIFIAISSMCFSIRIFLPAVGATISGFVISYFAANFYQVPFSVFTSICISCGLFLLISMLIKTHANIPSRLAHMGLALCILAASAVAGFGSETSLRMQKDSIANLGAYQITFLENSWHIGSNYTSEKVNFSVNKNTKKIGEIAAEKRHYSVRTMNMSEAGVLRDFLSDVYISLGTKLSEHSFAVRIQIKPFINLLWIGCALMILAGFIKALQLTKLKN